MPESCPAWPATGLSAIHPCDRPPKIVHIFTIGEISSTWPLGNSLDSPFYDGPLIAFSLCNQDSCWKKGRTDEYLGKLGKRRRDTSARSCRCAGDCSDSIRDERAERRALAD